MARRDKQQRRAHRHQKKQRMRHDEKAVAPVSKAASSGGLRKLTYQISFDSIAEPPTGGRDIEEVLTEAEREKVFDQINEDPAAAVSALDRLLAVHPDVPTLYNWMAAACTRAGLNDRAEAVVRLNYERHPKYLFALLNYADLLLEKKRPEEAAAVLNHKLDLKLLHPERDVFHITEFLAMSSFVVRYLLQTGKISQAEQVLSAMQDVAAGYDVTVETARRVVNAKLMQSLRNTSPFALGNLQGGNAGVPSED